MSETISLYTKMIAHWEAADITGREMREQAAKNITRLNLIYGGQMQFDLDEPPEAA